MCGSEYNFKYMYMYLFFLLLKVYASAIVKSFPSLIKDLRTEGVILVLKVVELVFHSFPAEGPPMFSSMLPGFLQTILTSDVSIIVLVYGIV